MGSMFRKTLEKTSVDVKGAFAMTTKEFGMTGVGQPSRKPARKDLDFLSASREFKERFV